MLSSGAGPVHEDGIQLLERRSERVLQAVVGALPELVVLRVEVVPIDFPRQVVEAVEGFPDECVVGDFFRLTLPRAIGSSVRLWS